MNWHDKILRSIELHVIYIVHGNSKKKHTRYDRKSAVIFATIGKCTQFVFSSNYIVKERIQKQNRKKARDCAQA